MLAGGITLPSQGSSCPLAPHSSQTQNHRDRGDFGVCRWSPAGPLTPRVPAAPRIGSLCWIPTPHVSSPSVHRVPPRRPPVPPPGSRRGCSPTHSKVFSPASQIEHFRELKGLDSSPIQFTGPSTFLTRCLHPHPALPCSASPEVSRENSPSPPATPRPLPDSKPPAFCFFPRIETTGARGAEDARPTSPRGPLHPQGPPLEMKQVTGSAVASSVPHLVSPSFRLGGLSPLQVLHLPAPSAPDDWLFLGPPRCAATHCLRPAFRPKLQILDLWPLGRPPPWLPGT